MNGQNLLIWIATRLNQIMYRAVGRESRPVFFDLGAFPALDRITQNCAIVREKLDRVLVRKETLPRYHDLDEASTRISTKATATGKC